MLANIPVLKGIPWYPVDVNIYRAAAFAAKIEVHKNTVKAWSLNGEWPDRRPPAGHRCYTEADMDQYFGVERVSESGHPGAIGGRNR